MTSIAIDLADGLSSATAYKGPCKVATTANITLSGEQTIDGEAIVTGDRVLVRAQTSSVNNGIYVADTGPWRRAKDFAGNRDVRKGTRVWVTQGNNGPAEFEVTTANPVLVGTDNIVFADALGPIVQANVPIYASVTVASGETVPEGTTGLRVNGYLAAGDGGAGLYKKAVSEPSHAGKFQSEDGAWWELEEGRRTIPDQLGAAGDAVTNDNTAANNAMSLRSAGAKQYLVNTLLSRNNTEVFERFIDTGVTSNPVARISNSTINYKITGQLTSVDGQGVNDVSTGASKIFMIGADVIAASYGWLSDVGSTMDGAILWANQMYSTRGTVIELNSPDGLQKNRLVGGNILWTGTGSTSTGSGWAFGVAGVKGWAFVGNLVPFTRQEGIHIEDEQLDGLISGNVFKCTLGHGAYLGKSAVSAGQGECDGFVVNGSSFKHASVVPELIATSTTSHTIGVASKVFTIAAGKSFAVNMLLRITSDANPTVNYMEGLVTAYSGTSLTVNVTTVAGAGTLTDWTIKVKREGKYGIYQVSAADGGLPAMNYSGVRVRGYEHGFNLGAGSGRRNAIVSGSVAQDCDYAVNLTAGACLRGQLLTENCPILVRANNGSIMESIVSDTVPTQILDYVGTTTNIGALIEHVQFPRLMTHGGAGTETFDLIDMPLNMKARVTLSLNNANTNFFASWDVTVTGGTAGTPSGYVLTLEDTASVRHQNMSSATLINNAGKLALQVSASAAIAAKTMIIDIRGQIYANADILVY